MSGYIYITTNNIKMKNKPIMEDGGKIPKGLIDNINN